MATHSIHVRRTKGPTWEVVNAGDETLAGAVSMKAGEILEVKAPESDVFLYLLKKQAPFDRNTFHAQAGEGIKVQLDPGTYSYIVYITDAVGSLAEASVPLSIKVASDATDPDGGGEVEDEDPGGGGEVEDEDPDGGGEVEDEDPGGGGEVEDEDPDGGGEVEDEDPGGGSQLTVSRGARVAGSEPSSGELKLDFKVEGGGELKLELKVGGRGGIVVRDAQAGGEVEDEDPGGGGEVEDEDPDGGGQLVAEDARVHHSLLIRRNADAEEARPSQQWAAFDDENVPLSRVIELRRSDTFEVSAPPDSDLYLCFLNADNQPFGQNAVRVEAGGSQTFTVATGTSVQTYPYFMYLADRHDLAHSAEVPLQLKVIGARTR